MLATIHGDICILPNMQHFIPNSESLDNMRKWCIKQNMNQFHLSQFIMNMFLCTRLPTEINLNPSMDN